MEIKDSNSNQKGKIHIFFKIGIFNNKEKIVVTYRKISTIRKI